MQVIGIKARIGYFFLILVIIILGLLSRRYSAIPLWIGDVLWAMMIYFIARFFSLNSPVKNIAIAALAICCAVEFSQLYSAPWINSLRHAFLGRMLLGEGFLWGDLLSYTIGVFGAIAVDFYCRRQLS